MADHKKLNDQTITSNVLRGAIVPQDQAARLAWLQQHAVPAQSTPVEHVCSLAELASVGCELGSDGAPVEPYGGNAPIDRLRCALAEACAQQARETGEVAPLPEPLRAAVIEQCRAAHERALAEEAASKRESDERHEREQRERAAALARMRELVQAASDPCSETFERLVRELSDDADARDVLIALGMQRAAAGALSGEPEPRELRDAVQTERDARWSAWLVALLSPEQRERFDAGVLPRAEQRAVAKAELFGFGMRSTELPPPPPREFPGEHSSDEDASCFMHWPSRRTELVELRGTPDMSPAMWARDKSIRAAFAELPDGAQRVRYEYVRAQSECKCIQHYALRVAVTVWGCEYSRLYLLDTEEVQS